MFGYIVYRGVSIMSKFNVLIKSAFVGTVGLVGSLFFLKKYNYKRTNMAVPPFSRNQALIFLREEAAWLFALNTLSLLLTMPMTIR